MDTSHPAVHPLGVFVAGGEHPPRRLRTKALQGMPGTYGGLALRLGQFAFAVSACATMICVKEFATVTAFCYLVASMVLQCAWSLTLAVIDVYALSTRRSLQNSLLISLFVVGDWVTSTLTFAAACSSTGIAVLIDHDLRDCGNQCGKYETSAALTFLSWVLISMSFLFTFWLLATR
ncbi:hypothetical protein O6H91_21G002200 [Diphasiastrum complanatum]|uniref:Uncharacterized protein n=1 Tax=Diphasiastrum complanatum TaxID=34168 RepID=A0ACC2AH79_DIPCM|nr:hypothetical protein O6H91_21G002200 [Diphasiastrum complanatum]